MTLSFTTHCRFSPALQTIVFCGLPSRGPADDANRSSGAPETRYCDQGSSVEEARANLIEALSQFVETADASEVARWFHSEVFVTQVEVPVR
jgi:hypothetical protein